MEKSIRMEKKDLSFTKLHRVSKQAAHLKSMKSLFKHPVLKFPYVAELVQRPTPEYGGHLVNQKESHSDIASDGGWKDSRPEALLGVVKCPEASLTAGKSTRRDPAGKDSSAKGVNSAQGVIPSNGDPDNASSRGRGVPPIEI